MRMHRTGTGVGMMLVALLSSTAVHGQQDVEKQVSRMNKKAMEDYDSLEFESARKTLIDAVSMLRSSGHDETPLAAKTYINLGVLYMSGFKDKNRGVQQFLNALKIKPDARLDPALATPELEEAFAVAMKQAGIGRGRGKAPPEPARPPPEPVKPPSEDGKGLQHNPIDEARPNRVLPVRATLASDIGATKVFLFFRPTGQEDFILMPMRNTAGTQEWTAVIPADAVEGRALQYYLEARDARGRTVMGSGSALNPHIIAITGSAAPPSNVPEVDVEDPLLTERLRKKKQDEERRSMAGRHDRLFAFVMGGTGFGYQPSGNRTEVAWQYQPADDRYARQPVGSGGVAFAPAHLGIEIGATVYKGLSVSALARFQLYTGANAETIDPGTGTLQGQTRKATGAIAGLLRLRYRFLSGIFHPFVTASAGGGQIRHGLDISSAQAPDQPLVDSFTAETYNMGGMDMSNPRRLGTIDPAIGQNQNVCPLTGACTDTIPLGYFLLGGGVGLWVDIWKYFAFIFDVNVLGAIGSGDSQSGLNIDAQAGFGVRFF